MLIERLKTFTQYRFTNARNNSDDAKSIIRRYGYDN